MFLVAYLLVTKMSASQEMKVKVPLGSKSTKKLSSKKHRWRPGTVAKREIRKFQKGTGCLLAGAPFRRLVRESSREMDGPRRWASSALAVLQEATESYLITVLNDAEKVRYYVPRVTLMPGDVKLALALRGDRI